MSEKKLQKTAKTNRFLNHFLGENIFKLAVLFLLSVTVFIASFLLVRSFNSQSYDAKAGNGDVTMQIVANPLSGSALYKGQAVTYTITLNNPGSTPTDDLRIVTAFNQKLNFVSCLPATCRPSTADSFSGPDFEGVLWNIGKLEAGDSKTFELTAKVKDDALEGTLSHIIRLNKVTQSLAQTSQLLVQTITHSVTIPNIQTTGISTPPSGSTVAQGQSITYKYTPINKGSKAQSGVVLNAGLDYPSVEYQSCTPTCNVTSGGVRWDVGTLQPEGYEANKEYSVTVKVANAAAATQIFGSASTISTNSPSTKSNEMSHLIAGANNTVRVTASKTANPIAGTSLNQDQTFQYILEINNTGSTPANNVRVVDNLDSKTTFVAFTDNCGSTCSSTAQSATWNLDTLMPGQKKYLNFNAKVNPGAVGEISNRATVSGSNLNTAVQSNAVNHPIFVPPSGNFLDLINNQYLRETGPFKAGDRINYEMTVNNFGNVPISYFDVVVRTSPHHTTESPRASWGVLSATQQKQMPDGFSELTFTWTAGSGKQLQAKGNADDKVVITIPGLIDYAASANETIVAKSRVTSGTNETPDTYPTMPLCQSNDNNCGQTSFQIGGYNPGAIDSSGGNSGNTQNTTSTILASNITNGTCNPANVEVGSNTTCTFLLNGNSNNQYQIPAGGIKASVEGNATKVDCSIQNNGQIGASLVCQNIPSTGVSVGNKNIQLFIDGSTTATNRGTLTLRAVGTPAPVSSSSSSSSSSKSTTTGATNTNSASLVRTGGNEVAIIASMASVGLAAAGFGLKYWFDKKRKVNNLKI